MSRRSLGSFIAFTIWLCLPTRCGFAFQQDRLFLSPALPIIGNQRFALFIPKGWRVRSLPDEAWNRASYSFDLVPVVAQQQQEVGIEILMHAIGRARRHGDLAGKPFKSRSGLHGIEHHVRYAADNDDWYFAIPYVKTDSAIIVRVLFQNGTVDGKRKFAEMLFQSVEFFAAAKSASGHGHTQK